MTFVLRMAWRETRTSWGRLVFFFLSVALGVASIVVLRSLVENVRVTLVAEARQLVGADVIVRSRQVLASETRADLDAAIGRVAPLERTEMVETQTMVVSADGRGTGATRLVEIRAVDPGFPLYGTLTLEDGRPYAHDLLRNFGLFVQRPLLVELGLEVGDAVRLGGETFRIAGVVTRDRVQRDGFAFGPRVYVALEDLRRTPLLGFGGRAADTIMLRLPPEDVERATDTLGDDISRDVAVVRSWRSVEERLGRNLMIAENHLSLVGFAVLILGGIGVWSVTRVVVQQKIRSVAILKCVGATSRQVLAIYVLQMLALAATGSAIGLGLAALAMSFVPASLLEPLGVSRVGLTASAAAQGTLVGLLVALLFSLVPLLQVRLVKPLLLLRADTATSARRRDVRTWTATAAVVLALVAVAVWQAGSWQTGLYVSLGLTVVAWALLLSGRLLIRVVRPLTRSPHFPLRHAVVSLGRPGNQTNVILLAVGLGACFVLGVRAVQSNLLQEFAMQIGGDAPDLVLIDIQSDQVAGVTDAVTPHASRPPVIVPFIRGRVVGLEGAMRNLPTREELRREGVLLREYGMTARRTLADNEQVLAGAFWDGPLTSLQMPDGVDTEVSVEQEEADRAGLQAGDLLSFEMAGVRLRTRVTSIRRVVWGESQNGGFVFVLRPGPAVDRVPQTSIGFVELGDGPDAQGLLQRALVGAFPNVSVVDVGDVIESIRTIVNSVTLAVTLVGAVILVGGVLILVGAVALTKFQRLYEAAIYRTLGASTRLLTSMVAIEYALLGGLAGALGAAGALGLSWVMSRQVFEIDWSPTPGLLGLGIVLTAVLVCIVGLASSADVLVRKPLATLRRE